MIDLTQLSPLMQRRIQRFKQHQFGYVSLWIFIFVLIISMFANLIANDRPLLLSYKDHLYTPIFKQYPETTFGGTFETETDYRDPVVKQLISKEGWMLWPPIPFSDQSPNLDLNVSVPSAPSSQNWLGTDDQGRDVSARILYGLRVSILFGIALTFAGTLLAILVGAVQGYFGGLIDLIGQRLVEVWGGMPQLFLTMILVSMFSPSVYWLFAIMLLFGWMSLVSLVRAEFLRARHLDYVRAAQGMGIGPFKIIFKHILPNVFSSSLSQIPFILTANITALSTLDFLGYGLPLGSPSLGELFTQARNNLDSPWLALSAFFTFLILLTILVFIGEAARDAFDPKR